MADDRLAPSREASIIAARPLRDSPRSAAMARSRRQNASSRETLVRCPAMTSERLMTRASGLPYGVGLIDSPCPRPRAGGSPESVFSDFNGLRRHFRVVVTSNPLVLRRREAASKDVPGGVNEAMSWTILRDAMLCIAPQDEAVGYGAARKTPCWESKVVPRS
jgi:hypothetical protein